MVEIGKVDTPNTHVYNRSLSWICTGTLIKSDGVKLVLWAHTFVDFMNTNIKKNQIRFSGVREIVETGNKN
jgi:hypothetical protein